MSTRLDLGGHVDFPSSIGPTPPMVHETRSTWLAYEAFYGLREKPFSLSSDSRFFYRSPSHAPAFNDLLAGIGRRESLSVLTGDIGTGKTTLCRAVLQNLDRKTFSAFVPDPFASREDLLKVLLMDFGVMSVDDLTSDRLKSATRMELSYLLYAFLGTLAPLQAFVVVIIDEAQNLATPLLEEIRILSDSDGRERQLQVVLVGQLELLEKLKLPEMRQVDQRVSVRCNLGPLDRDGVGGYVAHRLRVAGGTADRVMFLPEALDVVYQVSGGVPRLINRLCDRALYEGYHRRTTIIDREIVEDALNDDPPAESSSAPEVQVQQVPSSEGSSFKHEIGDDRPAAGDADTDVAAWMHAMDPGAPGPSIDLPAAPDNLAAREQPAPGLQRTYVQRIARRWLRRASLAAWLVLALGALTAGAVYVQRSRESLSLPSLPRTPELRMAPGLKIPAPLEAPVVELPVAGSYIIEVALFNSQGPAGRLVAELTGSGYRAYRAAFGSTGNRQQVLIGPYATRADAQLDLERVHQMPAYRDARVVEKSQ
jgi:type II secretory pathway predicted ATPase ExeA/cell division septation protein DedD